MRTRLDRWITSLLPAVMAAGAVAGGAAAQVPPPPMPNYGQPQPAQPAPAAAPAPAPAPYAQPAPQAPPPAQPQQQPPPAAEAGAGFSTQSGFDASGQPPPVEGAPPEGTEEAPPPDEYETFYRKSALRVQSTYSGSTGLLRVVSAKSGAEGTFRFSLLGSYYGGSGFLCNADTTCELLNDKTSDIAAEDSARHVGAAVQISATPIEFLEAYMGVTSHASSNDRGRPPLLQVLGDTDIGLKLFLPNRPDGVFTVGGGPELWLLNGSGGVGIDNVNFLILAAATADLNNFVHPEERIPFRAHLNLGYLFDNSGKLVEATEAARGDRRIYRFERFGLDINRVDFFKIGVGVEGAWAIARPFLEWTIDVPVNRQNHVCNETRTALGDECLGLNQGFSTTPSRIGLGLRVHPFLEGLALTGAVEIGTGATSTFIEEVAPELPWNLHFGIGYTADVKPRPETKTVAVERVIQTPPPPEYYIDGLVRTKGTGAPIADAIVRYEGLDYTGMVSGLDGRFRSRPLQPGSYSFRVSKDGFREGTCSAVVLPVQPAEPGAPPPQQPGFAPGEPPPYGPPGAQPPGFGPSQPAQPGYGPSGSSEPLASGAPEFPAGQPYETAQGYGQPAPYGQQPAPYGQQPAPQPAPYGQQPAQPAPYGQQPAQPAPQQAGTGAIQSVVRVECELEALPQVSNVEGAVLDGESGKPVGTAFIAIKDPLNRELELEADDSGTFRFENVPPGTITLTIEAEGYLNTVREFVLKARQDLRAEITLNKKPNRPNVVVTRREIKLKEQVHFQNDSADILPDSAAILEETAGVMRDDAKIALVEIQGHTDDKGSPEYNEILSQKRADAVRDALVRLGIDGSRLTAKGYGQKKPVVPNVSDGNRAKNRRVQLIIQKRD